MAEIHECTQEERIKSIENATDEILHNQGEQNTRFALLSQQLEAYMLKVEEHDRALKGSNGAPGIIASIANMQETYQDVSEALRGKGERSGLIALVQELNRRLTSKEDSDKWLNRLVLGALITFTITQVLGLIK